MKKYQQGFTLIELITAIILLGILSAFAISRFPSSQAYSTAILKNQFIASARLAQQTSLSRASLSLTNTNVTLNVSSVGAVWDLVVSGADGIAYSAQIDKSSEQIRYGTSLSASCSALASAPFLISFDGDGNRIPKENLRVCIDSDIDYELCISPSGYVYEGHCLP